MTALCSRLNENTHKNTMCNVQNIRQSRLSRRAALVDILHTLESKNDAEMSEIRTVYYFIASVC